VRIRRSGLSLIELLVVLTVIGVLVALLLPAVQSARETARRLTCRNRLKQLGLALHGYHDAWGLFPLNAGIGEYNETNIGTSWLTRVLPHIDEGPLYGSIQWGESLLHLDNDRASKTKVISFLCPSDTTPAILPNRRNSNDPRAVTNYKACLGSNWAWGPFSPIQSSAGRNANDTNGLENCNGFLCRGGDIPPPLTRLADVTDGTSATFAVGEAVPEWTWHTWWYGFNASTAACAVRLNHWYRPGTGLADWFENYSFSSRHRGGGHFLMIDGSVRYVSENISESVYREAATIQGAEVQGEL